LWTLTVIILLVAALIFSLQFKPVQTYIAKKVAAYLSDEWKTRVEVGGLYIKPFKSLVLERLYVEDRQRDTLLYSPRLTVDFNLLSVKQRTIDINTARLDSGKFYLKLFKDGTTNLTFIRDYFRPKPSTGPKEPTKPIDVRIDRVVLNQISFRYRNYNSNTALKRINFDDLDLNQLSGTITGIDIKRHLFAGNVNKLTFREKSGFFLKKLSTRAIIDSNRMEFSKLLLQTDRTTLKDYLLMEYARFADFNQFVSQVRVKAHLRESIIHSRDISYFTDATKAMNADLRVSGDLAGVVGDLRATGFSLKAGQATYVNGDFFVKGLPDINKTYLDLRIRQAYSNKKDAERIAGSIGQQVKLPAQLGKLGNVNYSGTFRGYVKDFRVNGLLKTRLGRINADLKVGLTGAPRYAGTLSASDFNLGALLDRKDIGRTSFTARVAGRGATVSGLNGNVDLRLAYADFRGYRYTNADVKGTFRNSMFDGRIALNDRNVRLNFNGNIDLRSPKVPRFDFTARIDRINLHKLGFTRDTLQIEADLSSNFSGSNLDQIQGNFLVRRLRMTTSDHALVVDSIDLTATGTGSNRSLAINSDILDASIRGQYHLNTLPDYFISVVKRYIPSLSVPHKASGLQNFEFNLRLKYFEPLALLLMPDLSIPEGAQFNGRFISSENIATLNGFSKLIQYRNFRVHNLIVDESTTANALNAFLTADRVDLRDSLYIQNVNMANILRNDSLNLNVKLSDKNATNQLDLNGLVEFGADTAARLSLLPSDVVINREVWRVQEQVKFKFDRSRLFVENFQLFRDNQLLTINGVVSNNPADELLAEFSEFNLQTFNPLARSAGIELGGEMNGKLSLYSLLKTPRIASDLQIDSLLMNNTSLGDLTLTANLDNSTKLVDVELNIVKNGEETLFASGTYDANSDKNSLDLDLMMDNSPVVVFQPFVKHLVTDLKGNVSANLKVTGQVLDPQINGSASLNNAALTVNYLKTPYRINDEVRVMNSIIYLDELELRDPRNSRAVAYGTVDMRTPSTPMIDVTLKATNFLALNTTEKDNPLYYGTAYATGTFSFRGPTNDMRIDINAKTEQGTVFTIPLNASQTVGNSDFVTFVAKDSSLTRRPVSSLTGLNMTFDLVVDEASQVNIITDLGTVNGRGDAVLDLRINSDGEFKMYGEYLVSSGKFEFTAQEYINKIFDISRGGSIRWAGDPAEADINLAALYRVRANIADLYSAAGRPNQHTGAVESEAIINIDGSLSNPNPSFDLNFPNDPYVRDELQGYFSDVNNRNTQAVSLIIRKAFTANTLSSQIAAQTITNAGTEILFNKVNAVIAQALGLQTVDINLRSLNEGSLSMRLFKDRLILTGGVTDRRANVGDLEFLAGGSNIARDLQAIYLIKKDGSLTARASNRYNSNNVLTLTLGQNYVTALGLVYRQDFDTFGEFLKALVGQKRREERTPAQQQDPAPPIVPPTTSPAPPITAPDNKRTPAPTNR
jgi:hypothetical protein